MSVDESQTTSVTNEESKKRFIKTEEDEIPLPDPFLLPKNFRSDVATALTSGVMVKEEKKSFFSSIAASMFTYKRYPSRSDYHNVAYEIIAKYPFLKSPAGSSVVS